MRAVSDDPSTIPDVDLLKGLATRLYRDARKERRRFLHRPGLGHEETERVVHVGEVRVRAQARDALGQHVGVAVDAVHLPGDDHDRVAPSRGALEVAPDRLRLGQFAVQRTVVVFVTPPDVESI